MKKSPKVGEKVFTFGYRDEMDMMRDANVDGIPLYGAKVTRKLPYTNNQGFAVLVDGIEYYCKAEDTFVCGDQRSLKKDSDGNSFFIRGGYIGYVKNNKLHRENAPALETVDNIHFDNIKWWMKKGHLHRENGPAYENPNTGAYHFWIEGTRAYNFNQLSSLILRKDPKAKISLTLNDLRRALGVEIEILPKLQAPI